jgi:hypothetical protein
MKYIILSTNIFYNTLKMYINITLIYPVYFITYKHMLIVQDEGFHCVISIHAYNTLWTYLFPLLL